MLRKVSPNDAQAFQMADWLVDSADRMERNLQAMAQQDQVTIASKPPSASKHAAQFLSGTSGYMLHTLTSAAGVHPGAQRAVLFYGHPSTRVVDFDQGHARRTSLWIAMSIELHLELCRLVVPVLGWQRGKQRWMRSALRPLAEEAQRRFGEPHLRAWEKL